MRKCERAASGYKTCITQDTQRRVDIDIIAHSSHLVFCRHNPWPRRVCRAGGYGSRGLVYYTDATDAENDNTRRLHPWAWRRQCLSKVGPAGPSPVSSLPPCLPCTSVRRVFLSQPRRFPKSPLFPLVLTYYASSWHIYLGSIFPVR